MSARSILLLGTRLFNAFGETDGVFGGGITNGLVGADPITVASATPTFTIPAGTTTGDTIIVLTGGRANETFTPPAAYRAVFDYTEGGNTSHGLYWRRSGADEGGNSEEWGASNNGREKEMAMVVVRGLKQFGSVYDVVHTKTSNYDAIPETPAITIETDDTFLLYTFGKRIVSTFTEDTGYPSGTTGIIKRSDSTSALGAAYTVVDAGSIGEGSWDEITGETNLHIATANAFRAAYTAPTTPPGSPVLWYKADAGTYETSGTSDACEDGDGVYTWEDQGSAGLDVEQASANDRPVYRADYASSGYPALEFSTDVGNSYLSKSGEPDLTGAVTVLAAIYLDDPIVGGEILNVFQLNSATNNAIRLAVEDDSSTARLKFGRPYGSGDISAAAAVPVGKWVVVAAKVGAATGSADTILYSEGSFASEAETLNDDGTHNTGDLFIGRFDSQFFDANMEGGIGEILVYGSELSDSDMQDAIDYLENRFGI